MLSGDAESAKAPSRTLAWTCEITRVSYRSGTQRWVSVMLDGRPVFDTKISDEQVSDDMAMDIALNQFGNALLRLTTSDKQ